MGELQEQAVLTGESLCRCYGEGKTEVQALSGVSFVLHAAEFVVVLGPSGSGKSTLLNLMGGMDSPTSGSLCHRGQELTGLSPTALAAYRRDTVGFVFQFFNLIPSLTARENVELAASISREPMDVDEALELVGLSGRGAHFPAELSGGEQQRVAIARAIVKRPALLLCDEPTGALDSKNGLMVVRLLEQVRGQLGCPVVTITHNADMARVANRVFHMKDGRLERVEENAAPLPPEELVW